MRFDGSYIFTVTVPATLTLFSACVAYAESDSSGVAVRDRERPQFDPSGVRLGAFELYPSLTTALTYNSNIYAISGFNRDDGITTIEPVISVQSTWSQHQLSAEAGGRVKRFFDTPDENSNDYYIRLNAVYDVSRSLKTYASLGYSDLTEPRTNNAADDGNSSALTAEPITYTLGEIRTGFIYTINRLEFSGDASYSLYDYDDQPRFEGGIADQEGRGNDAASFTGQASWALSPDTNLFVRGIVNRIDYKAAPPTVPFDRDARGYEVVAGTEFQLGKLAAGEIFLGYQEETFTDDPNLVDAGGIDYGASVQWYASELTTVTLLIENTIDPTTVEGASSFNNKRFLATLDHELLRNILVQATASYGRETFNGIDRKDEKYNGAIRLDYLLNRRASFFSDFTYAYQESNIAINSFRQSVFTLGVTMQL